MMDCSDSPAEVHSDEAIDWEELLYSFEDDVDILTEITGTFLANSPGQLAQVQDAIIREDGAALERSAHSLKGSLATFRAHSAVEAAQQLENMGREGNLTGAKVGLLSLEEALERVKLALGDIEERAKA